MASLGVRATSLEPSSKVAESQHQAEQNPAELIQRMSVALRTLNYEATFVHLKNGTIDAMRIIHSSDPRGELEYMLSLNGEAREIIRDHSLVTCIWPNSDSVMISKSRPRQLLPAIDASLVTSGLYRLRFAEPDRVAGRTTHVVEISPRDSFRYGYRFWIDTETDMLLRSMLLDDNEEPVEQVMFTSIDYPETVDMSHFEVGVAEEKVTWREPLTGLHIQPTTADEPDRISFVSLPEGYAETSETFRSMPINDGPVSHVMVSDGMASVSIYVEYSPAAEHDSGSFGLSRMGAVNAFGLSRTNAFITVVGEVPEDTVRAIAEAVKINQ